MAFLILANMWHALPVPASALFIHALLLYGNLKKQRGYYCVYFVTMILAIFLLVVCGLFVVFSGSALTTGGYLLASKKKDQNAFGLMGALSIT